MRHIQDMRVRDPFILTDKEKGCYYLIASDRLARTDGRPGEGVDYLRSEDLIHFEEPKAAFRPDANFFSPHQFWAPEVHAYKGRYYLFVTTWGRWGEEPIDTDVLSEGEIRGTQIFVADEMTGPYREWSHGPVTTRKDLTLDGTLYVAPDGKPYMIYCHEWRQIIDGTIVALPLTEDLRAAAGDPVSLFKGSDAPWATGDFVKTYEDTPYHKVIYVTDGPFLFNDLSGGLCILWSTGGEGIYTTGISRSPSGNVLGPWEQSEQALFTGDGGHAMLFHTLQGQLMLALHQPNGAPDERLRLFPARLTETGLALEPALARG